jgi:beta-glucanase (GH16 family)
MKKYIIVVFCFTFSTLLSKAQTNSFQKLVWSDEFNHTDVNPDSTKWNYDKGNGCPQLCGWGNNEKEFYTASRLKNSRVENGNLVIEVHKEDFMDGKYTSARLTTKNKGDWKYGRLEIKAKIPKGRGIWPAIWMLPTKSEYGQWPKSGEIDIMENVGYLPDSVFATVHTQAYNGMHGTHKTNSIFNSSLASEFHVYAVEWNEEKMEFFIDGFKYQQFANEHKTFETWPFNKEFFLLINVAVGGHWGGKFGVDDSIFPQKMEIDYVRVYQ